jgi:hypothetical protein
VEVDGVLDSRRDNHMLLILHVLVNCELFLFFLDDLLLAQVCNTLLPELQILHIFFLQLPLLLFEHVLVLLLVMIVLDVLACNLKFLHYILLAQLCLLLFFSQPLLQHLRLV